MFVPRLEPISADAERDMCLRPGLRQGIRAEGRLRDTIISEWVDTGFDEVLIQSLSAVPAERPPPSKVLESEWFQTTGLPKLESPRIFALGSRCGVEKMKPISKKCAGSALDHEASVFHLQGLLRL
ncbi:unnamed protein product [Effrenium voratum]|nr:unnamed protein product [Effrenium voratum]